VPFLYCHLFIKFKIQNYGFIKFLSEPSGCQDVGPGIHFLLNYGAFEFRNGKKVHLPFKYYLDETIETVNWDKGKAKMIKTFPQYLEFNIKLDRIRNLALSIYRKLENDGVTVSEKTLRTEFDKELKMVKDFSPDINMHMVSFSEDFLMGMNSTKRIEN